MDNGLTPRQPAESAGVATAQTADSAGSQRGADYPAIRVPAGVPLIVVLLIQALLSVRLLHADTAFQDEAAYLWAGHLEWAHLLHGTPIPPFPAYFSGAPVIYPPLGALADSLGGLAGARVLSLIFMLGTTTVLYFTARRLFGRQAAFFAAALFAISGPTLHLGSFATFDAMAAFLVAVAVLFVVRAGERRDAAVTMIIAAVFLALANATSYSTAIFDPVVVLLALVTAFPRPGGRLAAGRSLILLAVLAALLCAGILIGGSFYLHGIDSTTLERVSGSDPALTVLGDAWAWTGLVFVVALCGVAVSYITREHVARTLLLGLLTIAVLLTPAEQAFLQTNRPPPTAAGRVHRVFTVVLPLWSTNRAVLRVLWRHPVAGGLIPTAQWWGVAIKNVLSASASATTTTHSALSSPVRPAENHSLQNSDPGNMRRVDGRQLREAG